MTLYISASSIIDFLDCSKRFEYRSHHAETVDTQETIVGSIVHKVIEEDWNTPEYYFAKKHMDSLLLERGIDSKLQERASLCLSNAFLNQKGIFNSFSEEDLVEYKFKEHLFDNVYMVGKIDRYVKSTNSVYDWKTGKMRKKNLYNDIQCIIYYRMIQKIFNRTPNVFLVHLQENQVLQFWPKKEYIDELFNGIIPNMVARIKASAYLKEGYFNGSCYNCPYQLVCQEDVL